MIFRNASKTNKQKNRSKSWFSCSFQLEGTLKHDPTRTTAPFPYKNFHPMQFLLGRKTLNSSLKYTLLPRNQGYRRAATCTLRVSEASNPCSAGTASVRIPRCPSPSCCTSHSTSCTSSSPLGPAAHPPCAGWLCACPQDRSSGQPAPTAAGLDLAMESSSHPTPWPVAHRLHRANVWITVHFKEHPAEYLWGKCWAKENQECWMRCNCRRGRGQNA